MTADAESQRLANVEGTRHMVEFADAVEAGRVHMVSSIAAAGLYKGTWREDMFEEAEDLDTHPYFRTKHESEAVVRNELERPWRVYRPGIVVGHSETGEMDKIDGPYYFFKLIRRIRSAVPQWMPMPGVEGREINIVPVDFVVRAMDHIAHLDGYDGKAFHLTDPNPQTAGEVIDTIARAAHAPPSSIRIPAAALEAAVPLANLAVSATPLADTFVNMALHRPRHPALGADLRELPDPLRLAPDAGGARGNRDLGPAAARPTHRSSGTTGSAISTPTCIATARLLGVARGRMGIVSGLAKFAEQQIPDELLRFGRRLLGNVSLESAVRGRIVMVTGASSGIGRAAAMKIADAGGIVLLVARTPEEARGDQGADRGGGRDRVHPPRGPLGPGGHRPDGGRGARAVTATSTCWSTTPVARSGARSRCPTTARTTSSGRCSSTTSARCG